MKRCLRRNRNFTCFRIFSIYKYYLRRKQYSHICLIIFGIYIVIVSGTYFVVIKPRLDNLLIPSTHPHDRNFTSKVHHQLSLVNNTNIRNFILVTAASAQFVDRLENLLGSIHYHEPYLLIIVFDLGMTKQQLSRLSCMINVQIEYFPFEIYPLHIAKLHLFAYKALLLKEAFDKYHSKTKAIFFLDAGSELRSSLDPIVEAIEIRGYFLTRQKTLIINHTYEQTFTQLNASIKDFNNDQYQTAAGILGFSTISINSGFYKDILVPFINCSLRIDCIAPFPSWSSTTHRFDQSVLSILVQKLAYQVTNEERFYGDFGSSFELDKTMVIFSRRWHCPKIYTPEIRFQQTCNSRLHSHRSRQVKERSNVYSCGQLTIVKFKNFRFELPVTLVYELICIAFISVMSCFYCCIHLSFSQFLPVKQIKNRIV